MPRRLLHLAPEIACWLRLRSIEPGGSNGSQPNTGQKRGMRRRTDPLTVPLPVDRQHSKLPRSALQDVLKGRYAFVEEGAITAIPEGSLAPSAQPPVERKVSGSAPAERGGAGG